MKKVFSYNTLSLFLFLIFGLTQVIFAERTIAGQGLGYSDGIDYAKITKDPANYLLNKKLDSYRMQRIFPSVMVHLGLQLFHVPINAATTIQGYALLNLILILISIVVWNRIILIINLSGWDQWLGYILLYGNFAILKMTFYMPVLTDTTAFLLGLLSLYCYLSGKSIKLLVIALLGAFTWPTMFFNAAILYVFPKDMKLLKSNSEYMKYLSLMISAGFLAIFAYAYFVKHINSPSASSYQKVDKSLLPISLFAAMYYLFFSTKYLLRGISFDNVFIMVRSQVMKRLATVMILFFIIQKIISYYSFVGGLRGSAFIWGTAMAAMLAPAVFLISHFVYFGPVIVIAIINFKKIARCAQQYGVGIWTVFFLNVLLLLNSESRVLFNFLPFVVFFSILSIRDVVSFRKKYYIIIVMVFALLFSRFWLPIGENLDLYFMNFGPWMAEKWYFLFSGIFLMSVWWMRKI